MAKNLPETSAKHPQNTQQKQELQRQSNQKRKLLGTKLAANQRAPTLMQNCLQFFKQLAATPEQLRPFLQAMENIPQQARYDLQKQKNVQEPWIDYEIKTGLAIGFHRIATSINFDPEKIAAELAKICKTIKFSYAPILSRHEMPGGRAPEGEVMISASSKAEIITFLLHEILHHIQSPGPHYYTHYNEGIVELAETVAFPLDDQIHYPEESLKTAALLGQQAHSIPFTQPKLYHDLTNIQFFHNPNAAGNPIPALTEVFCDLWNITDPADRQRILEIFAQPAHPKHAWFDEPAKASHDIRDLKMILEKNGTFWPDFLDQIAPTFGKEVFIKSWLKFSS